MTTATARKEWLDALADDALAEKAEAKARRKALAEDARAAARERHTLLQRRMVLEGKRLDAVRHAERATGTLVEALADIHGLAAEEAKILCALSLPTVALAPDAVARRLARLLSHTLKNLPTATPHRYGDMNLAQYFPRGAEDWITAEKRIVKIEKENEK